MIYPLVEYAHKIGKNTAEFTASDMAKFTVWWMKNPQRQDILKAIQTQQKRATKIGERLMKNRIADQSMIDDGEAVEAQEEAQQEESEVLCSLELTKVDIDALLFSISRTFEDYDMEGHEYGDSLSGLKEGLMGV